LFVHSITNL